MPEAATENARDQQMENTEPEVTKQQKPVSITNQIETLKGDCTIMQKSLKLILLVLFAIAASIPVLAADAPASSGKVVNINTASLEQLMLLPRIGPTVAERIVEFREANGPFKKATDILQVRGIGDASFELLRPYLVTEGQTTLQIKQTAPKKN
jgi:competence ComEA-like helix-hairpin-helix protein